MINNVTLVGRLTRDAELRYTGSGIPVASFSIAVDRPFSNNQGNRDTDFINIVAWRKTAETVTNFTSKGSLVGITGRIQTGSYQDRDGKTVYTTEVIAENFQMLEPKSVNEARRAGKSPSSNDFTGNSSSNSFNSNQSYNNQNSSYGNQGNNNNDPFGGSNNSNSFGGGSKFDNDPFESNDSDEIDISDDDLPF